MMNDELKPCPFCGVKPEVLSDMHRTWGLVMHRDGCFFSDFRLHVIPEYDFKAWNMRHGEERTKTDQNGVRTCKSEKEYLGYSSGLTVTVCSNCRVAIDDLEDCHYCPNCGAKVVDE